MQKRRLLINGKNVDLSGGTRIGVTLQANNLAELQNRQGDFSNLFLVPFTPQNREIMGDAENVNSSTLMPYRKASAAYEEDGIALVDEGTAEVEESNTAQGYKVKITGGNLEFFNLLPDVKVFQLGWDELDHLRDFSAIVGTRGNGDGILYPIINWLAENGPEFGFPEADTRNLYPCLFLSDVVAKLETLTGYKFKGSFIEGDEYPRVLIAPKGLDLPDEILKIYDKKAYNTNELIDTSIVGGVNWEQIAHPLDYNEQYFTAGIFEPVADTYGYFTNRGAVTLALVGASGGVYTGAVNVRTDFYFLDTNAVFSSQVSATTGFTSPQTTLFFNHITANITIQTGRPVGIKMYVFYDFNTGILLSVKTAPKTTFKFNPQSPKAYNNTINPGKLCDLKAKDLLKDILNARGLQVQTNALKKEIYFDYFDDIEASKISAPDWSQKIIPDTMVVGYKFGKYAQKNDFIWKADDSVPVGLNNVYFNVDDETLPASVTVINFTTSTCEDEAKFQNENVPHIRAIDASGSFTQTNYRLLLLERKTLAYDFKYFDASNTNTSPNDIPLCRALLVDPDTHYKTLQQILRKVKPIKVRAKLSQDDVNLVKRRDGKLGFLQAIYLDVHSGNTNVKGYFYINKIDKYIDGFATLELIRL